MRKIVFIDFSVFVSHFFTKWAKAKYGTIQQVFKIYVSYILISNKAPYYEYIVNLILTYFLFIILVLSRFESIKFI